MCKSYHVHESILFVCMGATVRFGKVSRDVSVPSGLAVTGSTRGGMLQKVCQQEHRHQH